MHMTTFGNSSVLYLRRLATCPLFFSLHHTKSLRFVILFFSGSKTGWNKSFAWTWLAFYGAKLVHQQKSFDRLAWSCSQNWFWFPNSRFMFECFGLRSPNDSVFVHHTVILVVDWNAHATNTMTWPTRKASHHYRNATSYSAVCLFPRAFFFLAILVAFATFVFLLPPFFLYFSLFLFWNV